MSLEGQLEHAHFTATAARYCTPAWHQKKIAMTQHITDTDRALDALHTVDPSCPREEWLKVLMGAHANGLSRDDCQEWSSRGDSFKLQDFLDVWKSIKPGAVGPGSLFYIAKQYGWTDPRERKVGNDWTPVRIPPKPAQPPAPPIPANAAAMALWERYEPATYDHPYLVQKSAQGVPLGDLRVVPQGENLHLFGGRYCVDGALVVPAYGSNGLLSLQYIVVGEVGERMKADGKPSKVCMSGVPMGDSFHVVGKIEPGARVFVCEGIGAAWACWQATGEPAVSCFGWGRVNMVARLLRAQDATAHLVLVPDVGKEVSAKKVAEEHGCAVAYMPEGFATNSDVNDFASDYGLETLSDLLDSAQQPAPAPEPEKPAPHLVPVSVEDVITNPSPAPEFAWDGYLPRGVVSMLGAHGGVGKSTVTLMLAVCVALGRFMFGVRTEEGPAIFVSLEDGARIIRWRLATICRVLGIDPAVLKGKLYIVDGTENPELFVAGEMSSRGPGEVTVGYTELEGMAKSIKPALIIVDNASDAFGADEINRRQVRGFIRSLGAIAKHNDCSVLLLAHVDKNTSKGEARNTEGYSGSTAWNNSVRSRLFMSRNTVGMLLLEHQKANFGKCRDPLQLIWPDGELPQLPAHSVDMSGMLASAAGRQTDAQAVELLKKMAEFEGRGEYMSPSPNARTNAVATLKSAFRGMPKDVLTELVRQCDRAKWIERMAYTTPDRKSRERWTVTQLGREFAGLPLHTQPQEEAESQPKTEFAPSAPSAPTCHESAQGAQGAEGSEGVRQVRPHGPQGCGEWARAQLGAELGAEVSADGLPLPGADHLTGADDGIPEDGVI